MPTKSSGANLARSGTRKRSSKEQYAQRSWLSWKKTRFAKNIQVSGYDTCIERPRRLWEVIAHADSCLWSLGASRRQTPRITDLHSDFSGRPLYNKEYRYSFRLVPSVPHSDVVPVSAWSQATYGLFAWKWRQKWVRRSLYGVIPGISCFQRSLWTLCSLMQEWPFVILVVKDFSAPKFRLQAFACARVIRLSLRGTSVWFRPMQATGVVWQLIDANRAIDSIQAEIKEMATSVVGGVEEKKIASLWPRIEG